jgi:large subunit ribosomal protein L10
MEKSGRKFKGIMVDELANILKDNQYLFFVNYQKIPNSKTEKLRRALKKSSSGLKVVKKSILKLALKKRGLDSLCDLAEESSAIMFVKDDPAGTSKILYDFSKADENMVIRGGYIEGEILLAGRIRELAMLPPREVLLAMVVGGMKAPISGLANVLRGNTQKLVYVLNAISNKERKGG